MKIGELGMKCGECSLIDHCGEPYSDIAICMERQWNDIDEETLYMLLETSTKRTKEGRLDDAYLRMRELQGIS